MKMSEYIKSKGLWEEFNEMQKEDKKTRELIHVNFFRKNKPERWKEIRENYILKHNLGK